MAIVLDDMEMYKKAIDIYLYGYENGSIRYYIDGETGQCRKVVVTKHMHSWD